MSSRARHKGFDEGEVREAMSHPLLGGDRLHPLGSLAFKNETRAGNSKSVGLLVLPPPPTAMPKSFHPVPSIYRAILVNIPMSLKKGKEKK